MDARALDDELARLAGVTERVRANLLEMELDPGRQLIAMSTLEGETAGRWAVANTALGRLWAWLELLDGVLASARTERGTRPRPSAARLDRVAALLQGPSLEVPQEDVPLDERDLRGGAQLVVRCSPDDLLAMMAAEFEGARACVAEIGAVWDDLGARLDAVRASLAACRAEQSLAAAQRDRLAGLERDTTAIARLLMSDPLAVPRAEVGALEASAAELEAEAAALSGLREASAGQLAEAERVLARVRAIHEECVATWEEARVKVTGVDLPEPPADPTGDIGAALGEVRRLVDAGAWGDAAEALALWTGHASAVREDLERITAANRAPIAARNELRGLLDAYRSKARRVGVMEEPGIADLFDGAHDVLYRAPTDVTRAAALVRECGLALPARAPSAGGSR